MLADPRTVLVVDDDPEINALVGEYVSMAGFSPRAAHDGAEAEEAQEALKGGAPALIVLDLMLPDTDGAALCRRLRARNAWAQVPVVILSAMEPVAGAKIARELGAAASLCKPFDPDVLLGAILEHAR